jgi:hypothetical protein
MAKRKVLDEADVGGPIRKCQGKGKEICFEMLDSFEFQRFSRYVNV